MIEAKLESKTHFKRVNLVKTETNSCILDPTSASRFLTCKVPFGKCWFYEKTHISDIGSTHQILLDIKQNQMKWPISYPLCIWVN